MINHIQTQSAFCVQEAIVNYAVVVETPAPSYTLGTLRQSIAECSPASPVLLLSTTPYAPLQMHARLQRPPQLLLLPLPSPSQLPNCLELLFAAAAAAAAAAVPVVMPAAAVLRPRLLHPAAAGACT
jgi:hypothetical protein